MGQEATLAAAEAAILAGEKALHTFAVRSSPEHLRALLSEAFEEIGASGKRFGLAHVLAELPKEDGWSIHAQDYRLSWLAEDVAHLTYRAFIRSTANDAGRYSLRSSIWRREDGAWRMWFHQGTVTEAFALDA